MQASGRVALDTTSASNLTYHVEATRLEALAHLAGQDSVQGSAVLDGTLTGNAASLQTTGKMNGSGLGWKDISALDANSQYTVTVPDLDIARARVQSTASATFVKIGALELNEVTATTTYQNTQLDFDATAKQQDREVIARGDVIFHPDHQEIHLPSLAVRTQGIEWRTAPGSAAAVRYGNDRIEVQNLTLVSGDQTIDASGAFALKSSQPETALTVNARNVDISQIERLALQNRGFTGRLDGTAKIQGSLDQPLVSGNVSVTNGGFKGYKYESLTAKVDYNPSAIGLDATLQQSPTAAITAKGTVPMTLFRRAEAGHVAARTGDEIDLRITSSPLDLGIVQGFTTAVTDVTGILRVDLRLTGAGEDPHAEGIIDIQGGGFAVPATGVSYSGLQTSLAVSPDRLMIPKLQIVDEEGEKHDDQPGLSACTHARWALSTSRSLRSNFELIDNELGNGGVESNLKVTGELRRPKIEGEVKLQAARLEVDKILALFYDPYSVNAMPDVVSADQTTQNSRGAEDATNRALSNAQSRAAAKQQGAQAVAPAPSSAFAPVQLQVHVRIPENLVLRGKSLRPGGADPYRYRRREHHGRGRRRHHQRARRPDHSSGRG